MKALLPFKKSLNKLLLSLLLTGSSVLVMGQIPAGTYTIGGTSPDYATFQAAADDLVNQGISGPVVFDVRTGEYDEQIEIYYVPGSSATNTITFKAETGDSTDVILRNSLMADVATNHIIKLIGANWVIIQEMTFDGTAGSESYGTAIKFRDDADSNTVRNCVFVGEEGTSSYEYLALIHAQYSEYSKRTLINDDITIDNNIFRNGEMAMFFNSYNTSYRHKGIILTNNLCENQSKVAISSYAGEDITVTGNMITHTTTNGNGIDINDVDNANRITDNKVILLDPGFGIRVRNSSASAASEASKGLIATNFVSLGGSNTGHGIIIENVDNYRVYHNSVNINGNSWNDATKAFSLDGSGSSGMDIRNNIFANFAGGYAYWVRYNAAVTISDYNDYFTVGNYLASWDNTITPSLEELKTKNGMDDGSITVNPIFFSDEDLHTTIIHLDGTGENNLDIKTAVPYDIDGEGWDLDPAMGADEFSGAGTPLAGPYTVGGNSPDFTTLSDAVDSLNKVGISDSVIFYLRDASQFSEQVEILPVSGSGPDTRVVFTSDSANSNNAVITYDATSDKNYTINMVRASYVDFKDLTIAASNELNSVVFMMTGMVSNDSITRCTIISTGQQSGTAAIWSDGSMVNNLYIHENNIENGYRAIHIDGPGDDALNPKNIHVTNNTVEGHYSAGIYLRDCNAPLVSQNTISNGLTSSDFYGIYLYYCINDIRIEQNKLLIDQDNAGIYLYYIDGDPAARAKIINNFSTSSGSGGNAIYGIRTYNTDYLDIYNNTIYIAEDNTSTSSRALTIEGGSEIKVKNNILVNFGPGYSYYNNSNTAVVESDYNNLFSAGTYLAYWGSSQKQTTFEDLLSVNEGKETNSYNMQVAFDDANLPDINSVFLDTAGLDLLSDPDGSPVAEDFYGNPRPAATPSIGAYEYSSAFSPITEGTYSIGLSGADYPSISAAFDDLQERGISGPVVLEIQTGQYEEFVGKVFKIPGTSSENTVTLQSQSGDADDVSIFYETDNANFRDIFHFVGVDHLIIKDVTITSTGTSYGRPLYFTGAFENVTVVDNKLASANLNHAVLLFEATFDGITIKDNLFTQGSYGIWLEGNSSTGFYSEGTLVIGNEVTGAYYAGIVLKYHDKPRVIANSVENELWGGFSGLSIEHCSEDMLITGNRVFNDRGDYGIYLNNCDATAPTFYGVVSNNMVYVGGTGYAYGIRMNGCTGTKVYNNSIYITSTYTYQGYNCGILVNSNNASMHIVNNSVHNAGNGYAYYVEDDQDIEASDHNNFFTATSTFAYWENANYNNLAALQAAPSAMDANSLELDPKFLSAEDLTSGQPGLHAKATPLPEVTVDIDSVSRDASTPDMGALEFICTTPVFEMITQVGCTGDSLLIVDNSENIAHGSIVGYNFSGGSTIELQARFAGDTVRHLFNTAGLKDVKYIVAQIAGCLYEHDFQVTVAEAPEFELITNGAYCETNDGSAVARVAGDGEYLYFWSNGSTDTIAENLALGDYSVAVSDTNGCTTDSTFTIGEAIQLTLVQMKPSTCGVDDGAAYVSATGGFEPYTFVWSNGETSDTNRALRAGINYVNVIDSKGCYAQGTINIDNDGTGPQLSLASLTNNNCFGDRLGSIDINIAGGTTPYVVSWSNGAETEDIDSIAAGIYNVVVTDADGCQGAASYEISQPSAITISPVVEPATCQGADGSAVAVVAGGTAPFVYNWSTGGIYQIEEGLAAGVYSVTVTDARGCEMVAPVLVNNINAPQVTITGVQGNTCSTTNAGSISTSVSGGQSPYNYSWSSGENTPEITGLDNGTYTVTVTDFFNCAGVASAVIRTVPPEVNPICVVSVDSITNTNLVVWEKSVTTDVSHYNIYRESNVRGEYQLIGSRPYDSLSIFTDSLADPTVRSWRYRLSVVDDCGNESELSAPHKTIHLTLNVGLNDAVNLIWDNYEGFNVPTYDIYKYLPATGWAPLTSIAADDDNSYSDQNVTEEDVLYYVKVIAPDDGCTATEFKATSLNSSRSNRKGKQLQTTGIESMIDLSALNIFPNPSSGLFNMRIAVEGMKDVEMKVYDITGKMVVYQRFENVPFQLDTQFDLSPYSDGIYQVHIKTGNVFIQRLIVKE